MHLPVSPVGKLHPPHHNHRNHHHHHRQHCLSGFLPTTVRLEARLVRLSSRILRNEQQLTLLERSQQEPALIAAHYLGLPAGEDSRLYRNRKLHRRSVHTMASSAFSSDEGEIVEATPLPRSEQNGDVDRPGRHRGRFPSREPEGGLPSRDPPAGPRRSRSPRGGAWNRPREDRRDRRDTRQFRVHYEGASRDDRRQYRDPDRPSSRGSDSRDERPNKRFGSREPAPPRPRGHRENGGGHDRGHDRDRRNDGYPDKRPRTRSRSPRGRGDGGRRDGGRYGADLRSGEDKYSAPAERRPQDGSMSKQATPVEAPDVSKQNAKTNKGATVERGINHLAISQTR